jgi:hypothetical protein
MVAAMPCANVISMNTSHSPFFSAPQDLADCLLTLGDNEAHRGLAVAGPL